MGQLLSLPEAAIRLGVHVSTIRAWVRGGQIPAYRLGQRFVRVDWEEVCARLSALRPVHHATPGHAGALSGVSAHARSTGMSGEVADSNQSGGTHAS
jgi:excisionase family DNA binding protein